MLRPQTETNYILRFHQPAACLSETKYVSETAYSHDPSLNQALTLPNPASSQIDISKGTPHKELIDTHTNLNIQYHSRCKGVDEV